MAFPIKAAVNKFRGLPPAFVFITNMDALRDKGGEYTRKIALVGVHASAMRALHTLHGCMSTSDLLCEETYNLTDSTTDYLCRALIKQINKKSPNKSIYIICQVMVIKLRLYSCF